MEIKKSVLIFGINGQDGAILAKLSLNRGYEVIGTMREQTSDVWRLEYLRVLQKVTIVYGLPSNISFVEKTLNEYKPSFIFALGAVTSVGKSFKIPFESFQSNIGLVNNVCSSVLKLGLDSVIFNPLSSEMYGQVSEPISYLSKLNPLSPYATAKIACKQLGEYYIEEHSLNIKNVVLFNHESELRGKDFVTNKIIAAAINIKKGRQNELVLGRLDISRDWGCAHEYCEIIMKIMEDPMSPNYIVLGTGKSSSLLDFVRIAFEINGLNWENHVVSNKDLFRKSDIVWNEADKDSYLFNNSLNPKKTLSHIITNITEILSNENWS